MEGGVMDDPGEETQRDMRRPWCQAAAPPVQYSSPVRPCGSTAYPLVCEARYGVLYNFCPLHRSQPEWAKAQPPRRPWWRRLLSFFGGDGPQPSRPSTTSE